MDYTIGQVAFITFYGLQYPDGDGQPLTWSQLDMVEQNKWEAVGAAVLDWADNQAGIPINNQDAIDIVKAADRAGGRKIVE